MKFAGWNKITRVGRRAGFINAVAMLAILTAFGVPSGTETQGGGTKNPPTTFLSTRRVEQSFAKPNC